MRIRGWVCSGVWMTTLFGAFLAGCGGEMGVEGEEAGASQSEIVSEALPTTEGSESESVSEALPTENELVEPEGDVESKPDGVTQLALGCPSMAVNWSQTRTTAWNGNTGTTGTYQCYGDLPATNSGFTVSATLTSTDRTGSAQYYCYNGSWQRKTVTCDGKVISTVAATGISTTCSSADAVKQKWISWFLADLKRCAGTTGLDWWVTQYNNNAGCYASNNYDGYGSKDACWRAHFRAAANENGNSYNEAQSTGHISSFDENHLCGSLAYPWSSVSAYGTSCKYRP